MKRFFTIITCSVALVLPWKLRIGFANLLGWWAQGLYFMYFSLVKFILKHAKAKGDAP